MENMTPRQKKILRSLAINVALVIGAVVVQYLQNRTLLWFIVLATAAVWIDFFVSPFIKGRYKKLVSSFSTMASFTICYLASAYFDKEAIDWFFFGGFMTGFAIVGFVSARRSSEEQPIYEEAQGGSIAKF